MIKFIVLNGPPRSGKDTIAAQLTQKLHGPTMHYKFAGTMKLALGEWLGLGLEDTFKFFEHTILKNEVSDRFMGMSPRQMLISFSEEWVKPKFGKDAFGKLMAARCANLAGFTIVISDCGFADELKPLLTAFGEENIALVRLHRQGCDFVGDSRSYIATPKPMGASERTGDEWFGDSPLELLPMGTKLGFEDDFFNGHTPEAITENIIDGLRAAGFLVDKPASFEPFDDEIPF